MAYPEFNSNLLISTDRRELIIYTNKLLKEKVQEGTTHYISISNRYIKPDETTRLDREWIYNSSMFNIFVSDDFINNHYYKQSNEYKSFLGHFEEFLKPFLTISKKIASFDEISNYSFAPFTLHYKTNDNYVLKFLFDSKEETPDYIQMLNEALNSIIEYNKAEDNNLKKAILDSYSKKDGYKYLSFTEGTFKVLNPLLEVGKEINEKYREGKDYRIKKPHIVLNKDDFNKHFVFDSNWVLVFDNLETMLIQPNDVSLYSSISEKNLLAAKKFYEETILPRHERWGGSFPTIEKQQEYYDYFELIIQAIISAYTALEAFANICIPDRWEYYTESNGVKTIYSKEAIERKFSLRDKFKKMLRLIIDTPDPSTQGWWMLFTELENLRNELIHTKQSTSEERYSKLLSSSVFDLVEVHKTVIKFYGEHIAINKKSLLEEYPYNFDYDDFIPGLMSNKEYNKTYRSMRNITLDEEE